MPDHARVEREPAAPGSAPRRGSTSGRAARDATERLARVAGIAHGSAAVRQLALAACAANLRLPDAVRRATSGLPTIDGPVPHRERAPAPATSSATVVQRTVTEEDGKWVSDKSPYVRFASKALAEKFERSLAKDRYELDDFDVRTEIDELDDGAGVRIATGWTDYAIDRNADGEPLPTSFQNSFRPAGGGMAVTFERNYRMRPGKVDFHASDVADRQAALAREKLGLPADAAITSIRRDQIENTDTLRVLNSDAFRQADAATRLALFLATPNGKSSAHFMASQHVRSTGVELIDEGAFEDGGRQYTKYSVVMGCEPVQG